MSIEPFDLPYDNVDHDDEVYQESHNKQANSEVAEFPLRFDVEDRFDVGLVVADKSVRDQNVGDFVEKFQNVEEVRDVGHGVDDVNDLAGCDY